MKGRKLKVVRTRTDAAFATVYHEYAQTIGKNAWNARVPGWEMEDVRAEMQFCLWRAFKTFDSTHGTDFGVYFWTIWKTQRAFQIRKYNALKRAAAELPFTLEELAQIGPVMYLGPINADTDIFHDDELDDLSLAVWSLIGMGYQQVEIKEGLQISNRRYYSIVESWRTPHIYNWLTGKELE